ncbi:hypothetical protein ACTXT7_015607 [Hymenolepis weldensis]
MIYIYLKTSENDDDGLFQSIIYLQRSSSNSEWRDLTWTTCADGCNIEDGFKNQRCVVIGTRSGGISLYALPTLDSVYVSVFGGIGIKVHLCQIEIHEVDEHRCASSYDINIPTLNLVSGIPPKKCPHSVQVLMYLNLKDV